MRRDAVGAARSAQRREWYLPVALTLLGACAASRGDGAEKKPDTPMMMGPQKPAGGSGGSDFGNPLPMTAAGATSPVASGAGGATSMQPSAPAPGRNASAVLKGSCASATVQTELLPSNVLFVLDRSGSMLCNPPPTTDSVACEQKPERADTAEPSKWQITTAALIEAVRALPASATVGLSYFSNNDSCGVNSNPSVALAPNGAAHQAAIESSLASVTPGGGTPLVGATVLAYKYLHESALAGRISGNEFVVLITDGAQSEECSNPPTCADASSCTDLLADQEVARAAAPGVGIKTFVIGVPGSEPARGALSRIAKNGGTAPASCSVDKGDCHFDMTAVPDLGAALAEALMQIGGQTLSCELNLPAPEDGELDLDRVNVVYSPAGAEPRLFYQDTAKPCDGGADGWQYTADKTKIRLCGPACETARSDMGGRIDVVLGCPAEGPQ